MPLPSVLVVDDDQNLRRILEAKLQRIPLNVTGACDLASAASALQHDEFAVVVIDERLPDGSSLAELPALRTIAPNSAFVLITAYEESAIRQLAENAGAESVLFKPFDLDALESLVRGIVRDHAAAR